DRLSVRTGLWVEVRASGFYTFSSVRHHQAPASTAARAAARWLGHHDGRRGRGNARARSAPGHGSDRIATASIRLAPMSISERILGKKPAGGPRIESVSPVAAIPGGELRIKGSDLKPHDLSRPRVRFGEAEGAVVISSNDVVIAKVPEDAGAE